MGDLMGLRQQLTGGHLCIDLTNVEMSTDDQQALLAAVQQTVIDHLARHSEPAKVVTISLAPNGPPARALRRAVA